LTAHSRQQLFPVCHIAESQDRRDSEGGEPIIALQDLKALGFRMKDRLAGLELNDCLLVMKVSEWKTITCDPGVIQMPHLFRNWHNSTQPRWPPRN